MFIETTSAGTVTWIPTSTITGLSVINAGSYWQVSINSSREVNQKYSTEALADAALAELLLQFGTAQVPTGDV